VKSFKELANYLFTNFTKETSYNSLKNILSFKNVMSVKNYIEFMEESYLLFEVFKYDYSLKKQYVSNKKIYVIDNGVRNIVSFYFSEDRGRLLENLVFIELKRRGKEIYFYRDKTECDFLIFEKNKITEIIQVTDALDENNKKRELEGLIDAARQFDLKKGLILTKDQEDSFQKDGVKILVVPIWKWLLK
jgi:predicted AAA+ superfamily ATPase